VIDVHCHLLPAVDDGPPDVEAALEQARSHVAAGVETVVCTPHVDWEWQVDAATIARRVDELRHALSEAQIPLHVEAGAEVGLTRALDLSDQELRRLRLAGGEWLLLEAPLAVSAAVEQPIAMVAMRGHRILLAHPERSPAFQRDPESLRRLVQSGTVRTQITATSLNGAFGSTVQRFARQLVREGLVDIVASDAHDARRRPPGLREAIVGAGFAEAAASMTVDAPAAVLNGGPMPARPAVAGTGGRRWPWRRRSAG